MVNDTRSTYLAFATLIGACVIFSCATTMQTRSATPSGFLENTSQLRPGEDEEAQLIYINPSANFASYDKIVFDPITIWLSEDSEMAEADEEELRELAGYLGATLVDHLKDDYRIVEEPGPGVMRVRVAITEAKGSNVAMDVLTTAIPQLRMITTGAKLATDTHMLVGRAAIEGEIMDSVTGERLMAAVDERVGAKALKGSMETWSDVKDAYDYWADRLKLRLAELRAGQ